jgi:hypothetical protein
MTKKRETTIDKTGNERVYVYECSTLTMTRDAFVATLKFLHEPKNDEQGEILEKVAMAFFDLWSDIEGDEQIFTQYTRLVKQQLGLAQCASFADLEEIADKIEDHLNARELLNWNG